MIGTEKQTAAAQAQAAKPMQERILEHLVDAEKKYLAVEVIPGEAEEGLVLVYTAGTYKDMTTEDLVRDIKGRELSVEDKFVAGQILEQLVKGQILYNSKEVEGPLLAYAKPMRDEDGEEFLYLSLRAIELEKGGACRLHK